MVLDFPRDHLPIRFGIVRYVRPAPNEPLIEPTIAALRAAFGTQNVIVEHYTLEALTHAIQTGAVDAFLSSSGFYVRMIKHGARSLATAASKDYPDPNHNDGSTFIVSAASPFKKIRDLKNSRLVTSRPTAFTGLQVPLYVIQDEGFNPNNFFKNIEFLGDGGKMREAIPRILAGEADVGFLRICFLEKWLRDHPEDRKRLRVVNRLDTQEHPEACARSTPLYPSWTIATTPATAPQVSRLIARSLLTIPPVGEEGFMWGVSTDYTGVDDVFRTLKIGDYAYLREWTMNRFLQAYGSYLLVFFALVLGLIFHSIRVTKLVRERTEHLRHAIDRQAELQRKSQMAAAHVERLGRISAVGQICTIVAHEMRQPLAAMSLYLRGLGRMVTSGRATPTQIEEVIEKMNGQLARADSIVSRVRSYARSETPPCGPVDLCQTVQSAITELSSLGRWKAHIEFVAPAPVQIFGEPLETELIALNLIRNALEAVESEPAGLVTATVCCHGDKVEFSVLNNGPVISPETLARLEGSAGSSKVEGLGLGLAIVRSILERVGGTLRFTALPDGGIAAIAEMPSLERSLRNREEVKGEAPERTETLDSAATLNQDTSEPSSSQAKRTTHSTPP